MDSPPRVLGASVLDLRYPRHEPRGRGKDPAGYNLEIQGPDGDILGFAYSPHTGGKPRLNDDVTLFRGPRSDHSLLGIVDTMDSVKSSSEVQPDLDRRRMIAHARLRVYSLADEFRFANRG